MPKPNIKTLISAAIFFFGILAFSSSASADIFVDNAAAGCMNGSTSYNPTNRTCTGGDDTVYTDWNTAEDNVSSGSEGAPRIINIRPGTYVEKVDITTAWTTWQKYPTDSVKPILSGNWSIYHDWLGLLDINASGVTIDGIEIRNSGYYLAATGHDSGWGIGAYQANSHITIKNCYIHHMGYAAIYADRVDYLTITGNEIYETDYCKLQGNVCLNNSWMGAITTAACNHVQIDRNYAHGLGGEGFNIGRAGEDYLVENNIMADATRVGIFLNQIRNTIARYNMVYCTDNSRYRDAGARGGHAIMVAREGWWGADYTGYGTNIDIYGNLTAGCSGGFAISEVTQGSGNGTPDNRVKNTRVYNNTFVESVAAGEEDTYSAGIFIQYPGEEGYVTEPSTVLIKNNIIWQTNGTIANIGSPATFSNNLWSKAPQSSARSSLDPTYSLSYPILSIADYLQKQSGWTNLTPNELTGQEFALRSTAEHAINKGANLGSPYNQLLNLSTSNFKTNTFNLIDQDSYGAWDIGAGVYVSGGDTTAPSAPGGLMVK
jgi:hypothetical protein